MIRNAIRSCAAGIALVLLANLLVAGSVAIPASAEPEGIDPELQELVEALAPVIEQAVSDETSTTHTTKDVVLFLSSVGSVLLTAWKLAPRMGKDPDMVASLARIEEKVEGLDRRVERVEESLSRKK